MSKFIRLIILLALGVTAAGSASAQKKPQTFKENVWLCVSPQAYDDAMVKVKNLNGGDVEPLKKELSDAKQCMFIDEEIVDAIMAPFALVLNREGNKVQVQFIVNFRHRIELLHRITNRYVLTGWTEEANLVEKIIL